MFTNKVVLVTGGSSGIGAATVELFAKEGASVAFVGRREAKIKEVVQRCENHGAKTLAIKADISKDEQAKTIVKQTVDKFGKLDILVNNAGILRFKSLQEPDILDNYDEIMNTNLRAAIHVTNLAIPYLKESKGNIINVSSIASTSVKMPGMLSYNISKAGMDQFTKSAAVELGAFGVRVNSVNPGPVTTEITPADSLPEGLDLDAVVKNMTVLGKFSDADEIGDIILYLASDKARSITGSCYIIDNGVLLK